MSKAQRLINRLLKPRPQHKLVRTWGRKHKTETKQAAKFIHSLKQRIIQNG
jgi:hypothetical protein